MTILVGMIGSDGIVFASDERTVRQATHESDYDERSMVHKIEHLKKHRVVFAGVGDHVTQQVKARPCERIRKTPCDFENIQRSLEKIAADTVKSFRARNEAEGWLGFDERLPRSLLVVFYGNHISPERQLWSVVIHDRPFATRISGYQIDGAPGILPDSSPITTSPMSPLLY